MSWFWFLSHRLFFLSNAISLCKIWRILSEDFALFYAFWYTWLQLYFKTCTWWDVFTIVSFRSCLGPQQLHLQVGVVAVTWKVSYKLSLYPRPNCRRKVTQPLMALKLRKTSIPNAHASFVLCRNLLSRPMVVYHVEEKIWRLKSQLVISLWIVKKCAPCSQVDSD